MRGFPDDVITNIMYLWFRPAMMEMIQSANTTYVVTNVMYLWSWPAMMKMIQSATTTYVIRYNIFLWYWPAMISVAATWLTGVGSLELWLFTGYGSVS